MACKSDSPQVAALTAALEKKFGRPVRTPSDFVQVADHIESRIHEHISDSTIKRLFKPGLRYASVSDHTLHVIARYVGFPHFEAFCQQLARKGLKESELATGDKGVRTQDLTVGDFICIAWQPDRECTLRFLGGLRFEAVETVNATIQPGDTFCCSVFLPGRPLYVDDFRHGDQTFAQYAMGTVHGLTRVSVLPTKVKKTISGPSVR